MKRTISLDPNHLDKLDQIPKRHQRTKINISPTFKFHNKGMSNLEKLVKSANADQRKILLETVKEILSDRQLYVFNKVFHEKLKISEIVREWNRSHPNAPIKIQGKWPKKKVHRNVFYNHFYRAIMKLQRFFGRKENLHVFNQDRGG
jgi:hypothetical protein